MWNNAGLSTSVLITTCLPANGMIHHSVAKIFVSTKLRDLGPKSSVARTFWRMVAACIRYQPHTEHLLWDMTMFNLASVTTPCVGTGFLGLAYPFLPTDSMGDTPEFPHIPSICPGDYVTAIRSRDVFRLAVVTPLPPVGFLETVLLSLKEGDTLSESTIRRLRRKEAERRAAAAEGRTPVSEYRKRKLKKIAAKTFPTQMTCRLSPEKESSALGEPDVHSPTRRLQQKTTMQSITTVSEQRKVRVEDIERLAASASARRRPDNKGRVPMSRT